jgi:hypothetical protein
MRIVLFYHSLISDWNHGNAHFLRGVVAEPLERGHHVDVYEPENGWSLQNLIRHYGKVPIHDFHRHFPLLALDSVAGRVRRLLVFQSLTIPGEEVYADTDNHDIEDRDVLNEPGWPRLAFVEHKFAGDPTNWWIPNHACIEAILRSSGLSIVQRPGHEIYLCRPQRTKSAKWDKREFLSAIGRPHVS